MAKATDTLISGLLTAAALCVLPAAAFAQSFTATKQSDDATSVTGNWGTPTNIKTDNGLYATFDGTTQDWLTVKTYGFAIPAGSIIDGIEVLVQGQGTHNNAARRQVQAALTKDGTNPAGTTETAIEFANGTDTDVTRGGPAALWGTTWSAAEINSANFGVMIRDNDATAQLLRLDYQTVKIYYRTVDTITVAPQNPTAGNKTQGATYAAERLTLATNQFEAQWTAITVNETGTAADADISDVRIYRDTNGNGVYDAGTDTAISGANTFTGGTVAITLSAAETITTTSQNYFIVYTLIDTATIGATVTAQVPSGGLTVTAPDLLAATNLPSTSPAQTITDLADTVTMTPTDSAPANVNQSADYATQRISLVTNQEDATWTAVTVTKTGTLADGGIASVNIYLDDGDNTYNAGDTLISGGADTFTSGASAITLSAAQTINTTPKVYHIVYTLTSTASPGATVGSRLASNAALTLTAPDIVAASNFPANSTNATVDDVQDTVTAARTDTAPANVVQGTQFAPMKISLVTDDDQATWTAVTVTKTGTLAEGSINDVDIYLDTGNGTWGAEDTRISPAAAGTFSAGAVTITLDAAQTITTSAKTYHIVYTLAAGANPSDTIGAEITGNTDLTVSGVDTVAGTNFPLNSSNATVIAAGENVTMTPTDVAPASADQGASDVALLKFTLATDANSANWTNIAVTKTGTLADSGIDTVKIYLDDGDDVFDAGDTLISPAVTTFSGGGAAIALSAAQTLTTTPKTYFVVYSFDALATAGATAGAELTSNAAITVDSPDLVLATNFAANSSNLTIDDVPDTVTLTPTDTAPGSVVQDAEYAPLKFSLATDTDEATWTAITITKTGNLADSGVDAVEIYLDDGDGVYNAGDTLISGGADTFTAGASAITLSAAQTINTTPQVYHVVHDLDPLATNGNTIGAQIASNGDITLSGVDTVASTNLPASSGNATVTDKADTVTMTVADGPAGSVAQDGEKATQRLTLTTDFETALWTAITVTRTGSGADSDIADVTIYRDANANGTYDAGTDTAISGGDAFSGGAAAITLSAPETITTGGEDYFIVYTVATTATVGATVGSEVTANTDLTLAGVDVVAATNFPANSSNFAITDDPDTVTVTPTDTAPAQAPQGNTLAPLRLSLATDQDQAVWTAITVNKLGNLADGSVTWIRIYLDDGDGVFDATLDTLISPAANTFTGGAVAVTLSAAQTINTTPKVYHVVYMIAATATIGNTIGARVASGALTVTAPDGAATTNLPVDSSLASIVQPPTVTASRVDLSPTEIGQGADYATQRIDLVTDLGAANVTAVAVTLAGSINRTNVTNVKIVLDDGSGDYGTNDSVLGSGNFPGGGTVNITLSPAPTATTSGISLFVVYTLAGGTPIGNTVGSSITAGNITVAAPATIAATNFPLTSANATVAAPDYGVVITAGTIDLGLVDIDQDYLVTTGVLIESVGNMAQTYSIKASTNPGSGSPWEISLSSGLDRFTVQALFNAAEPALGAFAEQDKLLDSLALCTGTPFAGDRRCDYVGPGIDRNLWLLLGLPTLTSTDAVQDIVVTVTAQAP